MTDQALPITSSSDRRRAGAFTFALLFSLESLTRSLNSTVLSVQAYDLLGTSRKVSMLAAVVSSSVLIITLMLPMILGRVRRRYAYSLGIGLMIAASLFLAGFTVPGQVAGTIIRNSGAAILHITLSLYIMDHIRKSDLARAEPIRLSLSTFSWVLGPALGVYLYVHFSPAAPQAAVIVTALLLLIVFWHLRLTDSSAFRPGTIAPFNPLANTRRFMAQPRLRLAWLIAFCRSCFWSTFFIYGPIMVIEGGLPKEAAGYIISASQILLFVAYGYGRLAQRAGVRTVITGCFVAMAFFCLVAGLAGVSHIWLAISCLLLASLAAVGVDGVGGIPFLRAVRFHERQRMTSVYRTYIECAELFPGLVFTVALSHFSVSSVFVIMAMASVLVAFVTWRHLPQSM